MISKIKKAGFRVSLESEIWKLRRIRNLIRHPKPVSFLP